jgi:hypothetical protein
MHKRLDYSRYNLAEPSARRSANIYAALRVFQETFIVPTLPSQLEASNAERAQTQAQTIVLHGICPSGSR